MIKEGTVLFISFRKPLHGCMTLVKPSTILHLNSPQIQVRRNYSEDHYIMSITILGCQSLRYAPTSNPKTHRTIEVQL